MFSTNRATSSGELVPISARGLTKRFGRVTALAGVTLQVPRNAVYALIGANGTGKSTLMRVLLNIHRANSGDCQVLGTVSANLRPRHFERIGYVAEGQYGELLEPFFPRWDEARLDALRAQLRVPLATPRASQPPSRKHTGSRG